MFLNPDKVVTMFSSKGKLEQCDNALVAALNGSLSIGCAAKNGTVLVSFKNVSPLFVKNQCHKVFRVCPSVGVTYSGLQPDFYVQLSLAVQICQDYFDVYSRFPYLDVFISEFSLCVQEHTQKGGLRPFGTFLIFAGETASGSCCYQMDPSGNYRIVDKIASGVGYVDANKFIERRRELLDDNVINCVKALCNFTGKDVHTEDVSIGVFQAETHLFTVYDQSAVQEVFDIIENK